MNEKILVVEDQDDIGALIALNLESLNYEVTRVDNGLDGYKEASENKYDLILLDIMLPGMDGLEVCTRLRAEANYTPILMLTAKQSEADRVVGLEVGADDYLTKPFSIRELQARAKALLRRMAFMSNIEQEKEDDGDELVIEDLRIHKSKREVVLSGERIALTAKEFDLLLYLSVYPGKVFTREQLLNAVWGYHHNGYEHTVNSHINRLRAKLEHDPAKPKYVLTVWGVGYKFYDK
jgi:DNA-binding response OmpR family regulator